MTFFGHSGVKECCHNNKRMENDFFCHSGVKE